MAALSICITAHANGQATGNAKGFTKDVAEGLTTGDVSTRGSATSQF